MKNPIAKHLNVNRPQAIDGKRSELEPDPREQIYCTRCHAWAEEGAVPQLVHSQCTACHRVIDECCAHDRYGASATQQTRTE